MRSTFLAAPAVLAVACASALPASAAEPARPIVLTVACYPPFEEAVKAALPRWNELHPGIRVELRSLPFGDHHRALDYALERATDLPDVACVEVGFLGALAELEALEDLAEEPYAGHKLLPRLLGFGAAQARRDGKLVALPAHVGPGTLFYRKDLLDRAGVTVEELTRSWDSYVEAGKKIRAATGAYLLAHASDVQAIVARAGVEEGDGLYRDRSGKLLLQRAPRFQRSFTLARRIREAGLDRRIGAWSNEWAKALRSGTIATVPSGSWLAAHLERWLAPDTGGLWRAAQLPGGAFTSWGGDFLAIPKGAAHKQAAWELIRFLSLDRRQQLRGAAATGMWPALRDAQDVAWIDEPIAFLGGQRARRLWKHAAARAPAVAGHWLDPAVQDILSAELEQVLEKGKEIPSALRDAELSLRVPASGSFPRRRPMRPPAPPAP